MQLLFIIALPGENQSWEWSKGLETPTLLLGVFAQSLSLTSFCFERLYHQSKLCL